MMRTPPARTTVSGSPGASGTRPRKLLAPVSALVGLTIGLGAFLMPGSPAGAASGDPYLSRQWALHQIGAPAAWRTTTGAGIRIGIIDTGVDANHEDLAGKVVAQTSCVGARGDPSRCSGPATDDHGHGTHVAAIAAAVAGNGRGIAGVAPGAELVVARALVHDGNGGASGSVPDVVAAIRWVVDQGARVVNLSLGSEVADTRSGVLELAGGIRYAWERGAVPVVAVGNENDGSDEIAVDYRSLPALMVGATGRDGRVAPYSNSLALSRWGMVAPGGSALGPSETRGADEATNSDVVSAWWSPPRRDAYATAAGTSMAAPHAAGGVALLLAQGLTPTEAVERLLATADRSASCGSGCQGRLDVARAVGPAEAAPSGPTPANPTPANPTPANPTVAASSGADSASAGSSAKVTDTTSVVAPPAEPMSPRPVAPPADPPRTGTPSAGRAAPAPQSPPDHLFVTPPLEDPPPRVQPLPVSDALDLPPDGGDLEPGPTDRDAGGEPTGPPIVDERPPALPAGRLVPGEMTLAADAGARSAGGLPSPPVLAVAVGVAAMAAGSQVRRRARGEAP